VVARSRAGTVAAQVEATSVSQRGLGVIVPASPAVDSLPGYLRVGDDRLSARVHGAGLRGVDGDDAELGLGAEHVAGGLVILLRVHQGSSFQGVEKSSFVRLRSEE